MKYFSLRQTPTHPLENKQTESFFLFLHSHPKCYVKTDCIIVFDEGCKLILTISSMKSAV